MPMMCEGCESLVQYRMNGLGAPDDGAISPEVKLAATAAGIAMVLEAVFGKSLERNRQKPGLRISIVGAMTAGGVLLARRFVKG